MLDSEKFLFSWWELVSVIRYFPPLQTQAQIITTKMMGPGIMDSLGAFRGAVNVSGLLNGLAFGTDRKSLSSSSS